MTNLELRRYFAARDLRALRNACGLKGVTVAAAVGVSPCRLSDWESRRKNPAGQAELRYARVVAGMERHLEVTW